MTETRRDRVTLAALLAVLRERDRVFIVRRMGPHKCEGMAGGTVQELRSTRCVEVCGDSVVERLALDLNGWPDVWPEETAPVLVVTIGGKSANKKSRVNLQKKKGKQGDRKRHNNQAATEAPACKDM